MMTVKCTRIWYACACSIWHGRNVACLIAGARNSMAKDVTILNDADSERVPGLNQACQEMSTPQVS